MATPSMTTPDRHDQPFELRGDDRAVVCVHGFTGTPYEMRYLGERLHQQGFTVRGLRLPGHGTTVDDLDDTTWADWAAAVDAAVLELRPRYRKVMIVGQSLGGLLALHAAARLGPRVDAVASLAAPLELEGLGGRVARWTGPGGPLHGRVRRLPKLGGSDVRDAAARAANVSYRHIPTGALASLCDFMRVVDGELPEIRAPLLVLHARRDHTAPVASALRIAERAASSRVRTRILEDSFHLISIDVERDIVAAEVAAFFARAGREPATARA
ncbi:MAG: alpha/beta fold hydrolase [Kofleriaceae bacterium]|nr:alpha/beta fold hydrolase [Kofleriaceae bacterium]MCB9574214.1 alpha/beta fold hydrolase [Kofleriaceae bacterium]